jgi:predicted NUDIX family phosphoesterase
MSALNKQVVPPSTSLINKLDEHILVVKRAHLFEHVFEHGDFQGIMPITDFSAYASLIDTHKQFLPRGKMETDPTYKQIIPYLIFTHGDRYFLMQRHSKASETRLQSKFSLGIGGHIREQDIRGLDIFAWAQREFHEEVDYQGTVRIEPIGLVNDDSSEVGHVHVGFVLLLHGDSDAISIKSELQSGALLSLEECLQHKDRMETWSALVYELLESRKA